MMLPPGRLRLATNPGAIGSPPIANTIVIVVVAAFAANAAGVPLMAAITGQCPNVETNEGFYPILYLYRRETKDSGGPGEFRGGMGATSCWIP